MDPYCRSWTDKKLASLHQEPQVTLISLSCILAIVVAKLRAFSHAMERMRLNGWIILYWVGYHVVLGGLSSYMGELSCYAGWVIILNGWVIILNGWVIILTGWVIILNVSQSRKNGKKCHLVTSFCRPVVYWSECGLEEGEFAIMAGMNLYRSTDI